MGPFAIAAMALGGLLEANSKRQAGAQESYLLGYRARQERRAARDVLVRGQLDAQRIREQGALVQGAQQAAYAGQGVALGAGGAPEMAAADTARVVALDQLTAINNAAREAWGLRVRAESDSYQGRIAKYAGTQGALGSLLGSAGGIAKASQ
jgi:hypothetical protein